MLGVEDKLQQFDELMRMTLQSITNVPMSVDAWEQSSLPTGMGGLGIPKALDIAKPAFISLLIASADLVSSIVPESHLQEKIASMVEVWQTEMGAVPPASDRSKQATWTNMLAARKAESLLENADVISRSRLLATSSSESAAWLSALPVATLGNLLDDSSLRVAVGLRLGAVVCTEHKCICGQSVDKYGHHGLSWHQGPEADMRDTVLSTRPFSGR